MNEISLTLLQYKILKIIMTESEESNPTKSHTFISQLGRSGNILTVKRTVQELRLKSFPICSAKGGYYYARTEKQLEKYISRISERVMTEKQTLEGLENAYGRVGSMVMGKFIHPDGSALPSLNLRIKTAIRTPSGSMTYMDLPLGEDEKPIIPEGMIAL